VEKEQLNKINSIDDLISIADSIMNKTLGYGADETEVFMYNSKSIWCDLSAGMAKVIDGESFGVSIRAISGKKTGFSSISSNSIDKINKTAKQAVESAKRTLENKKFKNLAMPIKRQSKSGIFDEKITELDSSFLLQQANKLIKETKSFKNIKHVWGSITTDNDVFVVVNSNNIAGGDKSTYIDANILCDAEKNDEKKTGIEKITSRSYVELENFGRIASQRATVALGSQKIKNPEIYDVIFDNYTSIFLTFLLGPNICATAVQKGKSLFENKINKKITSNKLTIIDDTDMKEGLKTMKYDHEGIPPKKKKIIEKGILKNFVYDSYSANIENIKSTGNALRLHKEPYMIPPIPYPINYLIKPGNKDLDGIIKQTKKGILVRYMLMPGIRPGQNPSDFALVAMSPYLIENYEIKCSLYPVAIVGEFNNVLNNIIDVGSDLKLVRGGKIPSLKIRGLKCFNAT
jgi:PmbA protein